MKTTTIIVCLLFVASPSLVAQEPTYKNTSVTVEDRVNDLLRRMTLEEKIDMLGGTGFESKPNARLGIPSLNMTDGPLGVRWGKSTAFPAGAALAASWDTSLVRRVGWALAREAKAKGRNVLLGPCINIQRVPQGGRNFESFSEDPYLAARMAVLYITGVQGEHVVATPKHYAVNNQEWEREQINVKVSERALREIYLPAFEASIREAGAWSIMNSYNKINGSHATENIHLNNDILKGDWAFNGFVMSDWGATHSVVEAANGGLDIEMPFGDHFGKDLLAAVKEGKVSESTINDKIARTLRVMFVSGIFDNNEQSDTTVVFSKEHRELNLAAARAGIVLLKNQQNLLPLRLANLKSLAVIGPNAATARVGGGGSSMVSPTYSVSPLEGIKRVVGSRVDVRYALGCGLEGDVTPIDSTMLHPSDDSKEYGLRGEYFDNMNFQGRPVLVRRDAEIGFDWGDGAPAPALPVDCFSVRWTGVLSPQESGKYTLQVASDDGMRLYLDDRILIDDWNDHALFTNTATVMLEAGKSYHVRLEYYENRGTAIIRFGWQNARLNSVQEAVEVTQASDVALVFAGLSFNYESEGFDRKSLQLPQNQVELINAVAKANPRTVVVINSGAPVLMSEWIDNVHSLVEMWYVGQEGGNAIADVLFGNVNPSGKLPCTFPKRWEDCSAYDTYPGRNHETEYADDIFVGYRHFDAKNIEPLFSFGYGLSYTTFAYGNFMATVKSKLPDPEVEVTLTLKNTGTLDGAEVVQVYVHQVKSSVERPVKELKAFQKVWLKSGEQKKIRMTLGKRAFAFYDVARKDWTVEPGEFEVLVGSSSRDICVKQSITLK